MVNGEWIMANGPGFDGLRELASRIKDARAPKHCENGTPSFMLRAVPEIGGTDYGTKEVLSWP